MIRGLLTVMMAGVLCVWACAAETGKDKDGRDIQYTEEENATEPPASPLAKQEEERTDAVDGKLELSDGKKLAGKIYLTRDQLLSFYDPKEKKRSMVALAELVSIESRVVVERMEPEWRWAENASDTKVFTGKEYPMREYETILSFKNGKVLTGECTALLYVRTENGESRFIIHKRDKGEVGQKLADLVYVKMVDLRKPSAEPEKKTEEKGK